MPDGESLVLRDQLVLPNAYVAPVTATERTVAEIWRTVLNMDCVGIDDDYVDLGGDSFLASVIFSMIAEKFAVEMPMATLIKSPTIAQFAREVEARRASG
jgi:acyl carrier protein